MSRGAARSNYLTWLAQLPPASGAAVAPGQDDLVMGYATGYRRPEVEAFVRSLRAVHAGPIVLFADADPAFRAWLAEQGVEAQDAAPCRGWAPLPVVARFADYVRFIDARPSLRNVLLSDVRDVVFQADPFGTPPGGVEVFVEDETRTVAANCFHSKYLRALAGDAAAQAIGDRPCLCAGTVIGPAAEIARLCRLILTLCAIPRARVGGGFGVDQAAMELAVHQGLVRAAVQPNYSRVATLGLTLSGVRVSEGRIVNPDGSISPVVHQYDRHPELMALVRSRWGAAAPDRVCTGPQGLARAKAKLSASLARYLPDLR